MLIIVMAELFFGPLLIRLDTQNKYIIYISKLMRIHFIIFMEIIHHTTKVVIDYLIINNSVRINMSLRAVYYCFNKLKSHSHCY